ncbi:flavodoxin domain-containing protein [Enterococcus sp. CWB-B31]|uniref:flavodoxin domain-containing protein n=1 Tax=Enterococcus sp. CWB-B31 TaxID=2885159 RepID=UPI00226C69CA|nr:flavodoxin domain-containing protein [Enterococcus sp. CWB-B31]MCB5956428.1 flavodoxin domain-containing protein [Enterococcus sp. CWB-B31]
MLIYDSKKGGTKEIVQLIADQLKQSVNIFPVDDIQLADQLSDAAQLVFCAPAYAGQLRKPTRQFLKKYESVFKEKELYLVNTGIQFDQEKVDVQLENIFPKALYKHAKLIIFAGTITRLEKMNFFERMILKKIFKDENIPFDVHHPYKKINQENIQFLVDKLNSENVYSR